MLHTRLSLSHTRTYSLFNFCAPPSHPRFQFPTFSTQQRGLSIIMLEESASASEESRAPMEAAATHGGQAMENTFVSPFLLPLPSAPPLERHTKVSTMEKCVIAPPRGHTATALTQQRFLREK